MGLYGVLRNALNGLDVTQAGLDVASRNVANASTTGYSKQRLSQSVLDYGGPSFGVKVGEVKRVMDQLLTSQLRGELTGAGYADVKQSYLERLEISFGAPGAANGVESLYSDFSASLDSLVASPENPTTRTEFVQNARMLATGLNSLSDDIQDMRLQTETEIGDSVSRINTLLKGIAGANQKIALAPVDDPVVLDQRDQMINELSGLMDVNVMKPADDGTVSVLTRSGTLLVSDVATELTFKNQQSTVTARSDVDNGTLGTIILSGPGRPPVDLLDEGAFKSGKLGALFELRDEILPDAQNSLDALADSMARAMSSYQMDSQPVVDGGGAEIGRSLDLDSLQYGDEVSFTYDDGTGATQTVTFVKANADIDAVPSGKIGVDFSSGDMSALQAEFATRGFQLAQNSDGAWEVTPRSDWRHPRPRCRA